MMMIGVKTQFEGLHKYEAAPDDVKFLRNEHRHIFKVLAKIEVRHDDRELEFFMVRTALDEKINLECLWGRNMSCERMCKQILVWLKELYGIDRRYMVRVQEDDENYAEVDTRWE